MRGEHPVNFAPCVLGFFTKCEYAHGGGKQQWCNNKGLRRAKLSLRKNCSLIIRIGVSLLITLNFVRNFLPRGMPPGIKCFLPAATGACRDGPAASAQHDEPSLARLAARRVRSYGESTLIVEPAVQEVPRSVKCLKLRIIFLL